MIGGFNDGDHDKRERVSIYARRSQGKKQRYSPEEQVKAARRLCDERGWSVRYILVEDDTSADLENRDRFQLLLDRAAHRETDAIIVWKMDRFARSLYDTLKIQRFLDNYDVALVSVTEPFDTTTSFGRFCFNVLASTAQLERDLISERSRMGMHARSKQHRWPNRRPPLGYNVDDEGYLSANHEEIPLIHLIWDLYTETKSAPKVAFRLRQEGIKNRYGKPFSPPEIYKVLDNELYVGRFQVGDVDDHVEEYRLLPDERFFQMRQLRRRRTIRKPPMTERRRLEHIDRVFTQWARLHQDPVADLLADDELTDSN